MGIGNSGGDRGRCAEELSRLLRLAVATGERPCRISVENGIGIPGQSSGDREMSFSEVPPIRTWKENAVWSLALPLTGISDAMLAT